MSRINMARVLLGGLAAGLLINIGEYLLHDVVLAEEIRATMAGFNLPAPGGGAIAVFVFLGFGVGITAVWLYAAIRPRYGDGPRRRSVRAQRCGFSRMPIRASRSPRWASFRLVTRSSC